MSSRFLELCIFPSLKSVAFHSHIRFIGMTFFYNVLFLGLAASTVTALPQRPGGGYSGGGKPGGGPRGGIRGPPAPTGPWRGTGQSKSPAYNYLFQHPLPIPSLARPELSKTVNGRSVDFYSLTIEPFESQIYPDLGPVHLIGYNGMSPGPTFVVDRGQETIVRALNRGSLSASLHLHGSATQAVWDGWADDEMEVGQWKDYYYPNYESGRSMWYHDHAQGHTSINAYYGQAGGYIIHDPEEDSLGLPSGQYDIPLAIVDKIYQSNGDLVSPAGNTQDFLGDIIHVNDQPWPYLSVEPRKYRFRIYDMSLSRPYDLYFEDRASYMLNFQVIASDCGLFGSPVTTSDVLISMGERYEVIIDFSAYAGQNITMKNKLQIPVVDEYQNTDKIMMFVVGSSVSDSSNNGAVPSILNPKIAWPTLRETVDHTFSFRQGGEAAWTINGIDFEDVNNRILAKPVQGAVELWELEHIGGQTVHPVHIHLVNLQVISRTGGSRGVLPYESAGLKDTVLLEAGETVQVLAYYGPWDGIYMFHCHNLIHEDHGMMAAMNISLLAALGYDTNKYADPTDVTFAPEEYTDEAFTPDAEESAVLSLANMNPYGDSASVIAGQNAYYATAGYPSEATATVALASPTTGSPTGLPTNTDGRPIGRPTGRPLRR